MDVDQDSARVTVPPPLIGLGLLLLGLALDRVLPWSLSVDGSWRQLGGGALILAGVAFMVSGAGVLTRAGTMVRPWKTTSAIVSRGVYAWTRNPMYLGMVLIYLGLALLLSSVGALLLTPVHMLLLHSLAIAREERYLEAKFGDAYLAYKARVRRWL